jgi:hypothetical protein
MERAPEVDGMFVGEPRTALALARSPSIGRARRDSHLTFRADGAIVPHRRRAVHGFLTRRSRRGTARSVEVPSAARQQPYVIVETLARLPVLVRFCVAPIHQGHKFREKSAKALVDEIERGYRDVRPEVLLPVGRHGHAERQDVQAVLRRADRRKLPCSGSATRAPTT